MSNLFFQPGEVLGQDLFQLGRIHDSPVVVSGPSGQDIAMAPMWRCDDEHTSVGGLERCSVSNHSVSVSSSAATAGCQSGVGTTRSICASGMARNSSSVLRGGVGSGLDLGRNCRQMELNSL